jgi:hypothetical protein
MTIPKREAELQAVLDSAQQALKALQEDPVYASQLAKLVQAQANADKDAVDARQHLKEVYAARLVAVGISVLEGGVGDDFSPALVEMLELESGWKWTEHRQLKASNAASYTKSPFEEALSEIRQHFTLTDPAIKAARSALNKAEDERERVRALIYDLQRPQRGLEDKVRAANQTLTDYLQARADRATSKLNSNTSAQEPDIAKNEARTRARKALGLISESPSAFLARYLQAKGQP